MCRLRVLLASVAVVIFSCGDDAASVDGDASTGADASTSEGPAQPATPMPPAPPAPVDLRVDGACPVGWTEIVEPGGLVVCEPHVGVGRVDCPPGEAHFPGEVACRVVGHACPIGDLPEGLPSGRPVLYVRAGAAGGDGTRATPFGTIGGAVAASTGGPIIAIGRGTYDEHVEVPPDTTLWGACARDAILTPSVVDELSAVLRLDAGSSEIRGLTLRGGGRAGIFVRNDGTSARIEGVIVSGVLGEGLGIYGGSASVQDIVVRDTRVFDSDGSWGAGIALYAGATGTIDDAVLRGNHTVGLSSEGAVQLSDAVVLDTSPSRALLGGDAIWIYDAGSAGVTRVLADGSRDATVVVAGSGTPVTLTDFVGRNATFRESDGERGFGMFVADGAVVDASRVRMERNQALGILLGEASSITARDLVLRETRSRESMGDGGLGIGVYRQSSVHLERAVLTDHRKSAIEVDDSSVTLVDVVVRDTLSEESTRTRGNGLLAVNGATITAERIGIARSRSIGLAVFDAAATLSDVTVSDTTVDASNGMFGFGIVSSGAGAIELTRSSIERNAEAGVVVTGVLRASDVRIVDQSGRDDGRFGRGLSVQGGGRVELSRAVLDNNRELGVLLAGAGTSALLEDVGVSNTRARALDGLFGRGVNLQGGATLEARRIALEGNRDIGLFASAATGTADELSVRRTLDRECAPDSCPESGMGVIAVDGGQLDVADFAIESSSLCGVMVAGTGELDLSDGVVASNVIGACVQADGYDLARLRTGVRYVGNGVNLDTTTLPVPEIAEGGTGLP